MIWGGSGWPDVSALRLGLIGIFVAVFVSALPMNELSCRGAHVVTSQLNGFVDMIIHPFCLSCTV